MKMAMANPPVITVMAVPEDDCLQDLSDSHSDSELGKFLQDVEASTKSAIATFEEVAKPPNKSSKSTQSVAVAHCSMYTVSDQDSTTDLDVGATSFTHWLSLNQHRHRSSVGADVPCHRSTSNDLLEDPPEILVAYLSGQPEAVAAVELLKEAQRVWNSRETNATRSPYPNCSASKDTLPAPKHSEHFGCSLDSAVTTNAFSPEARRYSHDDTRIRPYPPTSPGALLANLKQSPRSLNAMSGSMVAATTPSVAENYSRRASVNEASVFQTGASVRYKKNPLRVRRSSRQDDMLTKRSGKGT